MEDNLTFAQKHPKLNLLLGSILLIGLILLGLYVIRYVGITVSSWIDSILNWIRSIASSLDAVIIVALITATVSLISVIISSIVSKIIDYKKNRQVYLAKKREEPYAEFVDMIYKIQDNIKSPNSYTMQMMTSDMAKFSKQITLWGSSRVVKQWVAFRNTGVTPEAKYENLFRLEKIMNSMRKDLGLKKTKKGDLLAFFINDIKTVMKK